MYILDIFLAKKFVQWNPSQGINLAMKPMPDVYFRIHSWLILSIYLGKKYIPYILIIKSIPGILKALIWLLNPFLVYSKYISWWWNLYLFIQVLTKIKLIVYGIFNPLFFTLRFRFIKRTFFALKRIPEKILYLIC